MKQKIALLLIAIIVASAFLTLYEIPTVKADAITDAITLGLDWLDRMTYLEINSTHAVGLESPSLDFRIKRSDGYWTIALKKVNLNLPSSATMIRGGCLAPEATTDDLGLISGEIDNQRMKYYFDIDGDGNYNDTVLYVEYASMSDTLTRTAGKIVEYHDKGVTQSLQLEKTQVIATVSLNAKFTIDKIGGWAGTRYTIRPTTKGLADLYVWLGTTEFSWLGGQTYQQVRGVNYLDRALKLYRTWYGSGYILDRFDGHYGVTYLARPWAGQFGIPNYPTNPDLVLQPWYGTSGDIDAYIDNSNKTAGWYDYNNLPDSVTFRTKKQIAVYNTISRMVMPDDTEWDKCPFLCSDDQFCFAYRSRTGFNYARNQYLANGFEYDLINYCDLPLALPGIDVLLGIGTDAKSIRACGDMFKYGANVPYGLNTLKTEFIDSAQWDGNGIAKDAWHGTAIGWPYPAYGTHNTATYGNALVQYYKLTGDSSIGTRADEVIGVLLMLQNKIGTERYSRSRDSSMYRVEFAGSFLPGYAVAYSFGQQDIYSASWTDTIYNTLQFLGIFEQDPASTSYPCMGNAECTIPSVWTLIQYRTTGRTPSYPAQQYDYTLPFQSNVIATTDHGGSYGGDGTIEIISSNLQSTYIGGETGNVYQHTGKLDRIRLTSNGAFGDGWSSIEYQWSFSISSPATNWRTKVYFTIPDYYAVNGNGNSLTVTATLYTSGGQLVAQESRTPMDGIDGTTYESPLNAKLIFYENFAKVSSLAAGTYTVKLKFLVHSGFFSVLNLGYTTAYDKGLPLGMEYFGYDMEEALNPLVYHTLTIQSSTGGHTNWTIGQHKFLKNQKVTLDNIPDIGYEFYYWEIDGQPSGGQDVRELYMDVDHTIKPIFNEVQYYLAIARPYWASIYPDGGYFDPGIHVYPYASSNDPSMQFAYWTVDDDPTPIYDNPIDVYMDDDHNLMTYWEPRTPYLEIIKPAFGTTSYESGYYTYQQQLSVSAGSTDSDWAFDYWLVDGGYVQQHVNPYVITMDDDHTLDAIYKPKLTVQLMNGYIYTNPSAGELTGYYELGTQLQIEGYTTSPSWRFWKFVLDGQTIYTNPISITMNEPHTLQVYAEENTFDLTVSYDENHGDCNPSEGIYERLYNTLVEIWAYPDAGYKVHAYVVNGVPYLTDDTYFSFYMPEEDVTLQVQWEQIIPAFYSVGFYAWFDQTLATVGIKIDGQSGYTTNNAYSLESGWHTIEYYAQFYQWYYDQAAWYHDGQVTWYYSNSFDIYVDESGQSVTAYYHD